jgi:hypothetical protein
MMILWYEKETTQGRKRNKNESTTNVFDGVEIEIKQKGNVS